MHKVYSEDLYKRFITENDRIKRLVIDNFRDLDDWPLYEMSEYSMVRLQDNFNCFVRDITLAMSTSKLITMKGGVYYPQPVKMYDGFGNPIVDANLIQLTRRIENRKDALEYMRSFWSRNKAISESAASGLPVLVEHRGDHWEPSWFDKKQLRKAVNMLNQNRSPVIDAMTLVSNPINEMRPIRNYIAHRNANTGLEFKKMYGNWSGRGRRHPAVILFSRVTSSKGTTISRLENWIERLNEIALKAAE